MLLSVDAPIFPLLISARPSQIKQVLLNLVLNAFQQMQQIGRRGMINVALAPLIDESVCTFGSLMMAQAYTINSGNAFSILGSQHD